MGDPGLPVYEPVLPDTEDDVSYSDDDPDAELESIDAFSEPGSPRSACGSECLNERMGELDNNDGTIPPCRGNCTRSGSPTGSESSGDEWCIRPDDSDGGTGDSSDDEERETPEERAQLAFRYFQEQQQQLQGKRVYCPGNVCRVVPGICLGHAHFG